MQHMKVHRHWARRVEGSMVTLVSIICSLASAHAVWWFFSGLNWIDSLQWLVTILLAAGFVGLGFVISRALAHRILHKQKVGMVLFIALLYELVEVGCCFTQASIGIQHITWLSSLHGGLHAVVSFFCYVLLPVTPLFTVGLSMLEVSLDREKYGQEAPSGPVRMQPAPVNMPVSPATGFSGAGVPRAAPAYTPPYATGYQAAQPPAYTTAGAPMMNTTNVPMASYPTSMPGQIR